MSSLKMLNFQEMEAAKPLKQLTLRDRSVIKNIIEEYVGKDTTRLIDILDDYLKHREIGYVGSKIIQDDDKWLKVDVLVGDFADYRSTTYSFKQRHPNNPRPDPLV